MQPLNHSPPLSSVLLPLLLLDTLPLLCTAYPDLYSIFQSRLSEDSEIYLPTDLTPRWTTHGAPNFAIGVRPATEDDVVAALRTAVENDMPFLATGGGHGYTSSYADLQGGVQIDMSGFDSVDVDEQSGEVVVGAGAVFADLFGPVADAGREIQTGSCSCVGVIGATLGGGIGRYQGLHGLIVDALLSARVLLANGTIVEASHTSNPDLFWALRGAGMNFAIVLSATYTTHPQTNNGTVLNVDIAYPPAAAPELFAFLASFSQRNNASATGLPPALSIVLAVSWNDDLAGMNIVLNAIFAGPADTGLAHLAPLLSSPTLQPLRTNITTALPWRAISTTASFGSDAAECARPVHRNMYGLSIQRIDIPAFTAYFDTLSTLMHDEPTTRQTHWIIEGFPNTAARAVPSSETAYPHRDAFAHLLMAYVYPRPGTPGAVEGLEERIDGLAREARAQLQAGGAHEGVYVSYGHGDEGVAAWYGEGNLGRLRELKRVWDPEGWFGWNNGVLRAHDG
ncbi:FAD-dependent oxidase [Pseudovirgaria hyperparasitica]|uniref:FAD-dependent oxidase n=1 Tax=Pseudovirgaria hyperparasitica TaxID=470096 RepID=A0A6A6WJK9_9PEZI|nr:FAD-dependent oxidase [Pseudovirgaria hyperparasitica]KAF2761541.1 FAD-dependent oxidase [Pseudovirgaria hyperparasitica]